MKRIFLLFGMLFVAFSLSPLLSQAQTKEQVTKLYDEARKLQESAQTYGDLQKAESKYEQVFRIFEKEGYKQGVSALGNILGQVNEELGHYDKALQYCSKSLPLFRELKNRTSEEIALSIMGLAHLKLGQHQKSAEDFEKSLAIQRELKNRNGEGATLGKLGSVYTDCGQYSKAVENYEKSLAIQRELKDRKGEGVTLNELGEVYKRWGQHERSMENYEKALTINRELKDRKGEEQSLNNLGILYYTWDQYEKAVECHLKSVSIAEELKDRKGEGSALRGLGNVYRQRYENNFAVEAFEKSLSIAREIRDRTAEAWALQALGNVYNDWGQYDKAVEFYHAALSMAQEIKDRRGEGNALNGLGKIYRSWGQPDKAKGFFEKVLSMAHELGERNGEGLALIQIGETLQQCGEHKEALATFEKCLAIYAEIKVPTGNPKWHIANTYMDMSDLAEAEPFVKEVNSRDAWARFYLLKANYSKAKEYYERILKSAEENRNADNLFTAYSGLGAACEGLKEDAAAAENYERAVKHTEGIRSSLSVAEREKFFDVRINGFSRTAPYEGLARVQLRLNKPQEAFKTTEYTRARVFAEAMTRMSEGKNLAVPPEIAKQDNAINTELASLKKNLQKAFEKNNKLVIQTLEPQVKEKEAKLQAHVKMLREKYPLFAATKYPQPMDLSHTALKDHEWVLSYDVTDPGILIYLTKGKTLVKSLYKSVTRKEMDVLVDKFRKPMEMDETGITAEKLRSFDFATGKKLADILLADILGDLPKGAPVVIVPGGCLGGLPFEMLVLNAGGSITKDTKAPSVVGAEFFGDRNPISYYQSVTALTLARQFGKRGAGQKLLVLDDPIFRPDDPRYKQMKQSKRVEMLSVLDQDRLQSIRKEKDWNIERLPRTSELGGALESLYSGKVDRYTGLNASKKVLFDKPLTGYGSMVFATHGCLDKDLPGVMEPALILTLVDQPKDQDGFLRMSEVMGRLNLSADVVALTACKSGLGHRTSGEGTMGMGRAFQYAGAKCVLMSLWSVSEAGSVKLVESFFKHVKDGKNKLEALRLARQEIRQSGYDHPFYWAPFILVGEVQ